MFKAFSSTLLGAALLIASVGSSAQTDARTAEALMRSSGMWEQLASVAPQARAGFLQAVSESGSKPSAAEVERLSKVIDRAYSPDRLRMVAISTFTTATKAGHVPALHRWFASPVGKTVTALEEAASVEQTDAQAMAQQGASLLTRMPTDRRSLLEELVAVTRSAEAMVQMTFDIAIAAQRGASSVIPNAPAVSPSELKLALEAQRPQLLQAFTGLSLAGFATAYASLPTSELSQYIDFLKSDAGRHFTEVGLQAFSAALVDASTELGRSLPSTSDKANT